MKEVLIGYITDEKYGKLSQYIDQNGKISFYRIIELDNYTINEELTEEETNELLDRLYEKGDFYYADRDE